MLGQYRVLWLIDYFPLYGNIFLNGWMDWVQNFSKSLLSYVNLWCCDLINILFCLDNFFCLDRSSSKFLQIFCIMSSEALLNNVTAHGQWRVKYHTAWSIFSEILLINSYINWAQHINKYYLMSQDLHKQNIFEKMWKKMIKNDRKL